MRQILIIGAGRSASSLIQYLLDKSEKRVAPCGDLSLALAQRKTNDHKTQRSLEIFMMGKAKMPIFISMLPAHLHIEVAEIVVQKKV
jgi:saccharopine dehydrogenase-like NADP-dependent oxidoreductase